GHACCTVSRVGVSVALRRKGYGMLLGNRGRGGWPSRSRGHGSFRSLTRLGGVALVAAVAVVAAGCSSSTSSTTATAPASSAAAPASSAAAPASSAASGTIPSGLTADSFTVDIASEMSQFKSLATSATAGSSGLQIGVILPDTTSSVRWVDFDAPYLTQA